MTPSLKIVSLVGLGSLKNLPLVINCPAKSAHLKELILAGVPNFMASSRIESWSFRSSSRLEIDSCMEYWLRQASGAIKERRDNWISSLRLLIIIVCCVVQNFERFVLWLRHL